jgi:hypothetical protein
VDTPGGVILNDGMVTITSSTLFDNAATAGIPENGNGGAHF